MDKLRDLIQINLTDKDGITVGGTNYKVANGAKILMYTKGYPTISFDNYINTTENMNSNVTTTNTLSTALGPVKFSGNMRPTIDINIMIPISTTVNTRAEYAAMTGQTFMTTYLLYNLWRYPHRIYLNDLITNTEIPNTDYPINILINRTDLLNQVIFSSDGIPVILKSVSQTGEQIFTHKDTQKEETWFEYKLSFVVDNYAT